MGRAQTAIVPQGYVPVLEIPAGTALPAITASPGGTPRSLAPTTAPCVIGFIGAAKVGALFYVQS